MAIILAMTVQREDGAIITLERSFVGGRPAEPEPVTDDGDWPEVEVNRMIALFGKAAVAIEDM